MIFNFLILLQEEKECFLDSQSNFTKDRFFIYPIHVYSIRDLIKLSELTAFRSLHRAFLELKCEVKVFNLYLNKNGYINFRFRLQICKDSISINCFDSDHIGQKWNLLYFFQKVLFANWFCQSYKCKPMIIPLEISLNVLYSLFLMLNTQCILSRSTINKLAILIIHNKVSKSFTINSTIEMKCKLSIRFKSSDLK